VSGANIGMFSIFAELQFNTVNALRIIAIEPVSSNFELLKKNLSLYAPAAHLYRTVIGEVDEEVTPSFVVMSDSIFM